MKRILPRLLACMLAVLTVLTLVACNEKTPENETTGGTQASTEAPTEAPTDASSEEVTTAPAADDGLVIADNGSTEYRIVYSRTEGEYAKYAASMLATKLQKSTGARIVIAVDTQPKSDKEIILGTTTREEALGFDREAHKWDTELYVGIYGDSILITAEDAYRTFDNLNLVIDVWLASYEENNRLLFNEDTCKLMMKPPADCTLDTFTMLSQNLYGFMGSGENTGEKRSERVLAQLKFYSPDIFSVNEQTKEWIPFFEKNAPEYGRVDDGAGGANNIKQYNSIYYKLDTVEVVAHGYQPNGTAGDSEGTQYDRNIIWAVLRLKQTGTQFLYVSTHLDTASDTVRVLEAQRVLKLIEDVLAERGDMPVFMAGDMNMTKDSGCYKLLTSFFDNVRETAGLNLSSNNVTFNNFGSGGAIIDFHFVSKDADVQSYYFKVVDDRKFGDYVFSAGCYTSDHYALFSKHHFN